MILRQANLSLKCTMISMRKPNNALSDDEHAHNSKYHLGKPCDNASQDKTNSDIIGKYFPFSVHPFSETGNEILQDIVDEGKEQKMRRVTGMTITDNCISEDRKM